MDVLTEIVKCRGMVGDITFRYCTRFVVVVRYKPDVVIHGLYE